MIFLPILIVNLLSQFIFRPSLKRYAELLIARDYRHFWTKVVRQVSLVALTTALLVVALWYLGVPILSWLYAIDLTPVRLEMLVVALGAGFLATCNLAYYILVIMRKQNLILITYGIGALAAIAVCWVLIGWIGLMGACIAVIVLHLLMLIFYVAFIQVSLHSVKQIHS